MQDKAGQARTDTASRLIHASPQEVCQAFVDASSLMSWLPPDGMSGRALEYDFRVGGDYCIELSYADPNAASGKTTDRSDLTRGRFLELIPGEFMKQSAEFVSDDEAVAGEMRMTWAFEAAPGGTMVTVTAENVPDGIGEEDHAKGLSSSLRNLARFVEGK